MFSDNSGVSGYFSNNHFGDSGYQKLSRMKQRREGEITKNRFMIGELGRDGRSIRSICRSNLT